MLRRTLMPRARAAASATGGSANSRWGARAASAATSRFGAWRWGLGVAGVAAFGTAAAATTLALCKAPDTPEYLLPHYLRSTRSRFNHYASMRDHGQRYMTTADFVAALLALPDKLDMEKDGHCVTDLEELFKAADANADGKISFREFSFLSILLITKMKDFELLFTMLDEEGKGGLSRKQFQHMITSLGDDTMKPTMKSGITARVFGRSSANLAAMKRAGIEVPEKEGGKMPLATYDTFKDVVRQLRAEVKKAEFKRFDKDKTGRISRKDFGRLLTDSILGRHLPYWIVENLRGMGTSQSAVKNNKAHGGDGGDVGIDTWLWLCEVIERSEHVAEAIGVFTATGFPLRQGDLDRCLTAAGLSRPARPAELALVFDLFDKDRDGTLEYDEFVSVLNGKATFHVMPQDKNRENVFVRGVKCASQVLLGNEA